MQNIADVFTARFTSVCARLGHGAGDLDGVIYVGCLCGAIYWEWFT